MASPSNVGIEEVQQVKWDQSPTPNNSAPLPAAAKNIWQLVTPPTITLALLLYAFYGLVLSKPSGNPYTSPCSWYSAYISRAMDCTYSKSPVVPVGPSAQLVSRELFEYGLPTDGVLASQASNDSASSAGGLPGIQSDVETLALTIANDSSAPVLDRLFWSPNRHRVGALDTQGNVHVLEQSGWSTLDTTQRGNFNGYGASATIDDMQSNANTSAKRLVAISPDSRQIVFALSDHSILVVDASDTDNQQKLTAHRDTIVDVQYMPSGNVLATASRDGTILLWDTKTYKNTEILNDNGSPITSINFDKSGLFLVAASQSGLINLWLTQSPESPIDQFTLPGKALDTLRVGLSSNAEIIFYYGLGISPGIRRVGVVAAKGSGEDAVTINSDASDNRASIAEAKFIRNDSALLITDEFGSSSVLDIDTGTLQPIIDNASVGSRAFAFNDGTLLAQSRISNSEILLVMQRNDGGTNIPLGTLPWRAIQSANLTVDQSLLMLSSIDGERIFLSLDNGIPTNLNTEHIVPPLESRAGGAEGSNNADAQSVVFAGNGDYAVVVSDGTANIVTLTYLQDASINPTAINMQAGMVFGDSKVLIFDADTPKTVESLFPNPITDSLYIDNQTVVAVGKQSSVYIGQVQSGINPLDKVVPAPEKQSFQSDVVRSQQQELSTSEADQRFDNFTILGSIANFTWRVVNNFPSTLETDLNSITSNDTVLVAVGNQGSLLLSLDSGVNWQQTSLGGESPPNLFDVRLDRIDNSNHLTFSGYKTKNQSSNITTPVLFTSRFDNPVSALSEIGDNFTEIEIAASAPLAAYLALLAGLAGVFFSVSQLNLWRARSKLKNAPVGAGTSDKPINWEDTDVLGLQQLARQVSRFLHNTQTESPLVIGVSGGWGSGKTSFMNLLCQRLVARGNSAIWFNAWHHQHEEHLLASLFESIRSRAIPKFYTPAGIWFRTKLLGGRLARHVRIVFFLTLFGLIVGVLALTLLPATLIQGLFSHFELFNQELAKNPRISWITSSIPFAASIIALLWIRSLLVALPTEPAKLFRKISAFTQLTSFRDNLNFRHQYGKEFREVCRALRMPGKPGLIIFIDDLDRCNAKAVLTIFEAINYLVSEGDCIVVMGFDKQQVEFSVGRELSHFADALPTHIVTEMVDNDVEPNRAKQRMYAKYYMEKLINIEFSIPQLSENAAADLAIDPSSNKALLSFQKILHEKDIRWLTHTRERYLTAWQRFLPVAVFVLGIAAIAQIWELAVPEVVNAYENWDSTELPRATVDINPSNFENQSANTLSLDESTTQPTTTIATSTYAGFDYPTEPIAAPTIMNSPLRASYSRTELWVLVPFLLIASLWALVFTTNKFYSVISSIEKDPESFADALKSANRVIQAQNGTPRAIKRFMNRMRFASVRMRTVLFEPSLLDWVAEKVRLVTPELKNNAVSEPQITDNALVAIGALESYVGRLDLNQMSDDPHVLLKNAHNSRPHQQAISKLLSDLLIHAAVDEATVRSYKRILYLNGHDSTRPTQSITAPHDNTANRKGEVPA